MNIQNNQDPTDGLMSYSHVPCRPLSKCSKCDLEFLNVADCLRHELQEHKSSNGCFARNKHHVAKHILASIIQDSVSAPLHSDINVALGHCHWGFELNTIFRIYSWDWTILAQISKIVQTNIANAIKQCGKFEVVPSGSTITGLALKGSLGSFLDYYIEDKTVGKKSYQISCGRTAFVLNCLTSALQRSQYFDCVKPSAKIKVPSIRARHLPSCSEVHITINCDSSVQTSLFFRNVIHSNPKIYELMLFLKIWAKKQKIIKHGYMSSYCFMTLVLFFLQQESDPNVEPIVPPISKWQNQRDAIYVRGVNYVCDTRLSPIMMPHWMNTVTLIKRFFHYYKNFSFEHFIVAPNYGYPISRVAFSSGLFIYPGYKEQLRRMSAYYALPVEKLEMDRSLIVQDVFSLNCNTAKHCPPFVLEYFRKCLGWAQNICTTSLIKNDKELYERLLFCAIDQINTSWESSSLRIYNELPTSLHHSVLASQAEVSIFQSLGYNAERVWGQHYLNALHDIITNAFRLSLGPVLHISCENPTNSWQQTWILSGTIDLWTGRQYLCTSSSDFMNYHIEQSEFFLKTRKNNNKFLLFLSARLTIDVYPNYELQMSMKPYPEINKPIYSTDPMHKLFAGIRIMLEQYNVKERLEAARQANPNFPKL